MQQRAALSARMHKTERHDRAIHDLANSLTAARLSIDILDVRTGDFKEHKLRRLVLTAKRSIDQAVKQMRSI